MFDASESSHRRFSPLLNSWVLCSPHRTKRPWQGSTEPPSLATRPTYDPTCYLCPGNKRAGGVTTENYKGSFVFENDFAALLPPPPSDLGLDAASVSGQQSILGQDATENELFQIQQVQGICHVICFSERHDLTVAEMSDDEILNIINTWTKVYKDVSLTYDWIKYIQIFENKGSIMGCSNPHPHGQSWSSSFIPTTPTTILNSQKKFTLSHSSTSELESTLLLSYITSELKLINNPDSRIIFATTHWVALVPFWAGWPFECLILPRMRRIPSLAYLTPDEATELSSVIRRLTTRMDNLFNCSFGYSMGLYQAPTFSQDPKESEWHDYSQFHLGFYPPLLRSSSVKKFLVGYELFAETQRDITPEQAAKKLRDCREVHYKLRLKEDGN